MRYSLRTLFVVTFVSCVLTNWMKQETQLPIYKNNGTKVVRAELAYQVVENLWNNHTLYNLPPIK